MIIQLLFFWPTLGQSQQTEPEQLKLSMAFYCINSVFIQNKLFLVVCNDFIYIILFASKICQWKLDGSFARGIGSEHVHR